jgi:hypothetical protein
MLGGSAHIDERTGTVDAFATITKIAWRSSYALALVVLTLHYAGLPQVVTG